MEILRSLPTAGSVVILVILGLFLLALVTLFVSFARYRHVHRNVDTEDPKAYTDFAQELKEEYAAVYRSFGSNTNTPALIDEMMNRRMHGQLLAERFMHAAVSMFVTLGLFGTFLGLSLSVSSLTDLISLNSSEEWLNILNSVGGGLMSALSGMGVAFYTSLVGVACAILFTVLRAVFNPQHQREQLVTSLELWLDHAVAPRLRTDYAADDDSRMTLLKEELRAHVKAVEKSLTACTERMKTILDGTTDSLGRAIEYSREPINAFYQTVNTFNSNVRDFSELSYDLRGSIERMDLCVRDLSRSLKDAGRAAQGGDAK